MVRIVLRTAMTLNHLGRVYQALGDYAEAESLYQRALSINEKALGSEDREVAQSLEYYASLLRQTARVDEAEQMAARARAIRAKAN